MPHSNGSITVLQLRSSTQKGGEMRWTHKIEIRLKNASLSLRPNLDPYFR